MIPESIPPYCIVIASDRAEWRDKLARELTRMGWYCVQRGLDEAHLPPSPRRHGDRLPAAVLLDVGVHDIDTLDCTRLRALPTIFVVRGGDLDAMIAAYRAGAVAVFELPLDFDELQKTLQAAEVRTFIACQRPTPPPRARRRVN